MEDLYAPDRRGNYWESVLRLIGHLIGTAAIFMAFILLGWFISIALDGLNRIHAFPKPIYEFVTDVELALVYIDAALCSVVLFSGGLRFCRDIIRSR